MKLRKTLAMLLATTMVVGLAACGSKPSEPVSSTPAAPPAASTPAASTPAAPADNVADSITVWVYPVGGWGDEAKVKPLIDKFTADTGIKVNMEWLAYADGDDKVNSALTGDNAPDVIMEGPERLVANWGVNGHMVDLSDMIDATDRQEILPAALEAGTSADGKVYLYPMFNVAHCMAVNYTAVKEAGAEANIDLETRTWTVEQFDATVKALHDKFGGTVAAVYCAGQGGDQGTRELIRNRYGTKLTNAEHTAYTWNTPEVINALTDLKNMPGIEFDASLAGGDEIAKFYQGVLKMAFCWNAAQQLDPNSAGTGEGKTLTGDEIVYMCFPTQEGKQPEEGSGVWGLGAFDTGDDARIAAAKQFIKYMCDSENCAQAGDISNFFSCRSMAEGVEIKSSNPLLVEYYSKMMPYMGEYYQITKGWAGARTEWWNMLQRVGAGDDIAETVAKYEANANAAAAG
ncbi:MAG: extracellular solute-binding protein [Lawsonibacter sp.]|nr:extracellular solute-binding protein [Lawsonibacter sp.]